jgi:hypothetical protein
MARDREVNLRAEWILKDLASSLRSASDAPGAIVSDGNATYGVGSISTCAEGFLASGFPENAHVKRVSNGTHSVLQLEPHPGAEH